MMHSTEKELPAQRPASGTFESCISKHEAAVDGATHSQIGARIAEYSPVAADIVKKSGKNLVKGATEL